MKPRYVPRDEGFDNLIKEATELAEKLEKAQPNFTQKEGSTIGPSHFVTETGGQTQTAHYTTNNIVPESTDIANKGATSENVNILDGPGAHFPTSESTLGSHQIGGDEQPQSLTKQLGADGEQLRINDIAKSINQLSRRIE